MKKLVYLAALLSVAAGSFAFLPKDGEPAGYMIVTTSYFGGSSNNLTVTSSSEQSITEINTKGSWQHGLEAIHKAEVTKLNELSANGWRVTQMNSTNQPNLLVKTYLLEKR